MTNLEEFFTNEFTKTHYGKILLCKKYKQFFALIFLTIDGKIKFKMIFKRNKDEAINLFTELDLLKDGVVIYEEKASGIVFEYRNKKIERNGKEFWDIEIIQKIKNYQNREFPPVDKQKLQFVLNNLQMIEDKISKKYVQKDASNSNLDFNSDFDILF